jgi:hypothetical protein
VQQAFSGNGSGTVADEGKTTQQAGGDSAAQPGDKWGDPRDEHLHLRHDSIPFTYLNTCCLVRLV